jgi:hypothetical protein
VRPSLIQMKSLFVQVAVTALLASVSLLACGGDGADGGDGAGKPGGGSGEGTLACSDPSASQGGRVACPGGSPSVDTALPTLQALRTIAEATSDDVKWLGGMLGQQIARDGTPTGGTFTIWMAGFCLGATAASGIGDGLNLSTNGTECLADRQCEALDCSKATDPPFPLVDSKAAIMAAFPDDPATTSYGLSYTAAIGDYWAVTSLASSTIVNVDATSGDVIP